MKGGFNKILRNIVAGSSDTEYEKVSMPTKNKVVANHFICFTFIETNKSDFPS